MSSVNLYTLIILLLLSTPMPMMAAKRKLHGAHEQNRLHDRQEKRKGLDKERHAKRKKFTPPPQAEPKEDAEKTET